MLKHPTLQISSNFRVLFWAEQREWLGTKTMKHLTAWITTTTGEGNRLTDSMQSHAVGMMFEPHFLDCIFSVLYMGLKMCCFIAPVLLWEAAREEQIC